MAFVKLASQQDSPVHLGNVRAEDRRHTIGDLAKEFGVSLRALRFYEDRALLQPERKGFARLYTQTDRVRLQMILKGKKLGFTLSEIRDMLATNARMDQTGGSFDLNIEQIVSQIGHLERQRFDLDQAIAELRATHSRLAIPAGHHAA